MNEEEVKSAIWKFLSQNDRDIFPLYDVLSEFDIKHSQAESVFMKLDMYLVGMAVSYGFSDTVLRDNIYEELSKKV